MTAPAITVRKPKRPVGYTTILNTTRHWPEFRTFYRSIKQFRFEEKIRPVDPNNAGMLDPYWGYSLSLRRVDHGWAFRPEFGRLCYWGNNLSAQLPPEVIEQVEFAFSEFMVKLQTLTGPLDERF